MWLRCSEQGANDDNDDNVTSSPVLLSLPLSIANHGAYIHFKIPKCFTQIFNYYKNDLAFSVSDLEDSTCPGPND